jgi:transcription antitermination factor NusG
VRLTSGVVNYVYWLGKPAIVRDREIKAIRQFLDEYSDIEVQPIERFKPGDRVVVQQGIFLGKSGIIKNVKNRTVEVQIESIGFMLTASFDKKRLSFQL